SDVLWCIWSRPTFTSGTSQVGGCCCIMCRKSRWKARFGAACIDWQAARQRWTVLETSMDLTKQQFIDLAIELKVLRFGQFTLKSGRVSPYFFNSGLFNTGRAATVLGRQYAAAVVAAKVDFDLLFG